MDVDLTSDEENSDTDPEFVQTTNFDTAKKGGEFDQFASV
jgi:hypothetical protein